MPKTGSSYLQASLVALIPQLVEHGIRYPDEWRTRPGTINHAGLFLALLARKDQGLDSVFERFNHGEDRIIVLSAEGFSGLSVAALARLRELVGDNPVEVVMYCRRWSDWIPSHWQQRVKAGSTETFPEACARIFSNPFARPMNFGEILDHLTEVFGRERVRLISYSNIMDDGIDMVGHFGEHFLGLPNLVSPRSGEAINASLSVPMTELNRYLNYAQGVRGNPRNEWISRILRRNASDPALREHIEIATEAMAEHVASIRVDDTMPIFRILHDRIMAAHGGLLMNQSATPNLFADGAREVRYITAEYLLRPRVRRALLSLNDELAQMCSEAPRQADRRRMKEAAA